MKNDALAVPGEEIAFFLTDEKALSIYLALRKELLAAHPDCQVLVQRSQISFRAPRPFVWVWLPASRGGRQTPGSLYFTFGAPMALSSARMAVVTEPYPGRFTHHVLINCQEEVDAELLGFAALSHAFRNKKEKKP